MAEETIETLEAPVVRPPATIKAEREKPPETLDVQLLEGATPVNQIRHVKLPADHGPTNRRFTLPRADALTVARYEPARYALVEPIAVNVKKGQGKEN